MDPIAPGASVNACAKWIWEESGRNGPKIEWKAVFCRSATGVVQNFAHKRWQLGFNRPSGRGI
jgi:hypothetical protein